MNFFFDCFLILTTTGIVLLAYKRVVFRENCSVANYVIIVLYVFCVLPIILNYMVGLPQYITAYWYKPFIEPMHNEQVSIIYDLYIMLCIATVYKGNIIKNLIMDCQSYTKYRPNETTGGIFVSWRRKEELPTGA